MQERGGFRRDHHLVRPGGIGEPALVGDHAVLGEELAADTAHRADLVRLQWRRQVRLPGRTERGQEHRGVGGDAAHVGQALKVLGEGGRVQIGTDPATEPAVGLDGAEPVELELKVGCVGGVEERRESRLGAPCPGKCPHAKAPDEPDEQGDTHVITPAAGQRAAEAVPGEVEDLVVHGRGRWSKAWVHEWIDLPGRDPPTLVRHILNEHRRRTKGASPGFSARTSITEGVIDGPRRRSLAGWPPAFARSECPFRVPAFGPSSALVPSLPRT